MNYRELYEKVVKVICERQIDSNNDIYEPEPPKALIEGKTYTIKGNGIINIRLDERLANEEDYKDFCRFAFEKIGRSLDDYLEEEKSFKKFKK